MASSSAAARAAPAERAPKAARIKQARQHFDQAQTQYRAKRYAKALPLYAKAYALHPHPVFLFNIGQCHRELGQLERALFFFERYLTSGRELPNRALVRKLASACRRTLEARRRALVRRIAPSRLRLPPGALTPGPVTPIPRPFFKRWWFWTVVAVGLAAVVGASLGATMTGDTRTVLPSGSVGTIDLR